jgi:hypothetical protein
MKYRLGAVFVGALVLGGGTALSADARAWFLHQSAASCESVEARFNTSTHGLEFWSDVETTMVFCGAIPTRMVLDSGQTIAREDVDYLEVSWSIPSGTTARVRTCISDAGGMSGSCTSFFKDKAGPFTGFTSLGSGHWEYWSEGGPSGFDMWDVPYLLFMTTNNVHARLATVHFAGD